MYKRQTLDRVLNNRGKVRPEVEDKVRQIADELGYRPNLLGRALGMSKNNIKIGVISQAAETPFMKAALKGVEAATLEVENFGGSVIQQKIAGISAEKTLKAMDDMLKQEVNAIAMMPVEDERILSLIHISGIHCSVVEELRNYYGLEKRPVKVYDPYQMLGYICLLYTSRCV